MVAGWSEGAGRSARARAANPPPPSLPPNLPNLPNLRRSPCSFGVFTIVAIMFGAAGGHPAWHMPSVGLIGGILALLAVATNFTLNAVDSEVGQTQAKSIKTAFAGFLMTTVAAVLLLFAMGAASALAERRDDKEGYQRGPESPRGVGAGGRARVPPPAGTAVVV